MIGAISATVAAVGATLAAIPATGVGGGGGETDGTFTLGDASLLCAVGWPSGAVCMVNGTTGVGLPGGIAGEADLFRAAAVKGEGCWGAWLVFLVGVCAGGGILCIGFCAANCPGVIIVCCPPLPFDVGVAGIFCGKGGGAIAPFVSPDIGECLTSCFTTFGGAGAFGSVNLPGTPLAAPGTVTGAAPGPGAVILSTPPTYAPSNLLHLYSPHSSLLISLNA